MIFFQVADVSYTVFLSRVVMKHWGHSCKFRSNEGIVVVIYVATYAGRGLSVSRSPKISCLLSTFFRANCQRLKLCKPNTNVFTFFWY
jgi:hypothetical protein